MDIVGRDPKGAESWRRRSRPFVADIDALGYEGGSISQGQRTGRGSPDAQVRHHHTVVRGVGHIACGEKSPTSSRDIARRHPEWRQFRASPGE